MKVYLAAPWSHKAAMSLVAKEFEGAGHTITKKWWEHREVPGYLDGSCSAEERDELEAQAAEDLSGIHQADAFVLWNAASSEGKCVEMGYAIANSIPVILIGGRSNLFHYLCDDVEVVTSIDEALMALDNREHWDGTIDDGTWDGTWVEGDDWSCQ